ncbi:transposase [Colletotrichum melonis]|uniref:Transposase n=1 Tax=Colletotrichum melonis TaxID=1209925 RepID=A0AAI9TWS2_9PEZI|nr:transposase [Colletotrichum melonis]
MAGETPDADMHGFPPISTSSFPRILISDHSEAEPTTPFFSYDGLIDFGNTLLAPGGVPEVQDSDHFMNNSLGPLMLQVKLESIQSQNGPDCWFSPWILPGGGAADTIGGSPSSPLTQTLPSPQSSISPASTASLGRSRVITEQEWEARKPDIEKLYMRDCLSRQATERIMAEQYQFFASSRQYKGRFQKWKWRKNNTKAVQQDVLAGRSFTISNGPTSRRHGRSQSKIKKVTEAIPSPMPNGQLELSATLLQCMRDLIHRSWKEDAVWTQPNRLGRLPVYGHELTSRVAVGLEHLAVQDTLNGFSAIRHMFRGLDDLVKKSDITIYATLLLDIPITFYEFKDEPLDERRLLNIYFLYLQCLLSHYGKGGSPIADAAHAMAQLIDKYYDEAQAFLPQLYRVVADSYRDVQGCDTFDNIERRIEAVKAVGGTSNAAETENIIIALDNMQFLAATNQGSLQSPNMIEYELWKIELLRSIEPDGKFVDRCNRLLNRIKSAAIDKEWRLWESWLLWISGEVIYELCRLFDDAGDDDGWAENLESCILRFRCAITKDDTWEELLGPRVMIYRAQLVIFWTKRGKLERAESHKRSIGSSAFWEAVLREDSEAIAGLS